MSTSTEEFVKIVEVGTLLSIITSVLSMNFDFPLSLESAVVVHNLAVSVAFVIVFLRPAKVVRFLLPLGAVEVVVTAVFLSYHYEYFKPRFTTQALVVVCAVTLTIVLLGFSYSRSSYDLRAVQQVATFYLIVGLVNDFGKLLFSLDPAMVYAWEHVLDPNVTGIDEVWWNETSLVCTAASSDLTSPPVVAGIALILLFALLKMMVFASVCCSSLCCYSRVMRPVYWIRFLSASNVVSILTVIPFLTIQSCREIILSKPYFPACILLFLVSNLMVFLAALAFHPLDDLRAQERASKAFVTTGLYESFVEFDDGSDFAEFDALPGQLQLGRF